MPDYIKKIWIWIGITLFISTTSAFAHIPFQVGDIIFRLGTDIDSLIIQRYEKGLFSHVGLIIQVEPTVQILHATTTDKKEKLNQVILSSFDEFTSPKLAKYYQVFRLKKTLNREDKKTLVQWAKHQIGRPFGFEENKIYCTKLVLNAFEQTHIPIYLEPSYISLFFTHVYLVNSLANTTELKAITPIIKKSQKLRPF